MTPDRPPLECAHEERCGLALPGQPTHSTCTQCRYSADDAVWAALASERQNREAAEREVERLDSMVAGGHDAQCFYCNEPCDSLAGNPGKWPIGLCIDDAAPGVTRWCHHECVMSRLRERDEARAEADSTSDALDILATRDDEELRRLHDMLVELVAAAQGARAPLLTTALDKAQKVLDTPFVSEDSARTRIESNRTLMRERDEARRREDAEVKRLLAALEARVAEREDDRRRALKRAYDLTLDTQTCDEAVASLVGLVRDARQQREAAEREVERLRAALEHVAPCQACHECAARARSALASTDPAAGPRDAVREPTHREPLLVHAHTALELVREQVRSERQLDPEATMRAWEDGGSAALAPSGLRPARTVAEVCEHMQSVGPIETTVLASGEPYPAAAGHSDETSDAAKKGAW